jgi:tRNA A22 N-methylase
MGRRRRDGNHTLKKNNAIEDLVGNEKNGYPVPDPNKTMVNVTYEPSDAHKKFPREEITEKLMEKTLDMVIQKIQDELKKFQDTKNKDHEKKQKQINELRKDFNKHQSETKDTIKKKRYKN